MALRPDPGYAGGGMVATPLANSLWNLLYRSVASTDASRSAWPPILRGSCLGFFKEPIDGLPAENEEARQALRERILSLPVSRILEYLAFLLRDDRAGLKEVDRKLLRRGINPVLEEEGGSVRLLRDRFVPVSDEAGLDALDSAAEALGLFDLPAASRHLESAIRFLGRLPEPACPEAVREAVLAVACATRAVAGAESRLVVGALGSAADRLGIPAPVREGADRILSRCHAVSGLPGAPAAGEEPLSVAEAAFHVVFCASLIRYLLSPVPGGSVSGGEGTPR